MIAKGSLSRIQQQGRGAELNCEERKLRWLANGQERGTDESINSDKTHTGFLRCPRSHNRHDGRHDGRVFSLWGTFVEQGRNCGGCRLLVGNSFGECVAMEAFPSALTVGRLKMSVNWTICAVTVLLALSTGCGLRTIRSIPPAPPTLACGVSPTEVVAGELVTVTTSARNFNLNNQLAYTWSSSGGSITAKNSTAMIDTTNLPGGAYSVSARAISPKAKANQVAACTANFVVKQAPRNPPTLSVSASPTSASYGERVTLTANCASPDGIPVTITWATTSGTVVGTGQSAVLNTTGAPAGMIHVTATCSGPRGLPASASTDIAVELPPPPPETAPPPPKIGDTGRDFLLSGDHEKAGYGMYSYLLWWDMPIPADRTRFINIISAFLLMPKITAEEGTEKVVSSSGSLTQPAESTPRANLNVAYIPVNANLASSPTADWILDHYDLARARILLRKLPRSYRSGPYIISTLTPLSLGLSGSAHYLFQNLSAPIVPPELADGWIRQFQQQAQEQQFWEANKMQSFVLSLRATVAELATAVPQARAGLATWIAWLTPPKH
jgi:hypothetical protein